MIDIDYIHRTRALAETTCAVLIRHGEVNESSLLKGAVEDKLGKLRPTLMFYGCYNAGKSTLINAIMGKQVAPVSDRPQTDRVTSYEWRSFELLDTPGIDAPIEHERVSEAQIVRSDVVLFVVSSNGAFEERGVIEAMVRIIKLGKPLLVVINNKSGIALASNEMMQARSRLLDNLVRLTNDPTYVERFSIHLVNAQMAWKARTEKKDKLLNHSGILELERVLAETLVRMDGIRQLATPLLLIDQQLSHMVERLRAQLDKDSDAQPQQISARLREARNTAVGLARIDLQNKMARFETRVRAALAEGRAVEPLVGELSATTADSVEHRFSDLISGFDGIGKPASRVQIGGSAIPTLDAVGGELIVANQNQSRLPELAKDAVSNPATQKAIVEGLKHLRSMGVQGIKGRWTKTLEMWGSQITQGLGVVVSIASFAIEWKAAEKAHREYEAAKMAHQQMIAEQSRAYAAEVAEYLLRAIDTFFNDAIGEILNKLNEQVRAGSREREALDKELQGVISTRDTLARLRQEIGDVP